ncbi:MAG: response regulator transcription factor [Chloroflexi bacterium]|nr:response regulator transcription factor [Chloroflexota bacterium]
MAPQILIAEDDRALRDALRYTLTREGYQVLAVGSGTEAVEAVQAEPPDLLLLDLMLPGMDGLEVCRRVRSETATPILVLTARQGETDKVVGLELGADDYMTKPFSTRELLARIRALLRRSLAPPSVRPALKDHSPLRVGDLVIDRALHRVALGHRQISLSPKEFDLLAFLGTNTGIVFNRDTLLERVWGRDFAGGMRTVDVHMRWLREKIEEDPAHPRRLLTVRGIGYKLEA